MANVLIGWEFGANRGHAARMVQIAAALRRRGHRINFAVQRIDALAPDEIEGAPVWPAPVTPRLLINTAKPRTDTPSTLGDIVARLGADDAELVGSILKAWARLLAAIGADVIVAEFAPFLLTAARGRLPTISGGTGFDVPPGSMPRFPSLTGRSPVFDEASILKIVNQASRKAECRPLAALPELFAADRELAATFRELDPYAEWREEPLCAPAVPLPLPELGARGGDEVFVYAPEVISPDAQLWTGLAASKLPVRVHVPNASASVDKRLRECGFLVEPEPLPLTDIARRSRLLVSHGGHGFICSGLLAGLPHIVCHYDVEKLLHGRAVARMGLGGLVGLHQIDPGPFAESLIRIYRDDSMAERARLAAPAFRERNGRPMEEELADAVEQLV